jgi:hypothetical protein
MDMGDAQRIIIVEPERVPAEPVEDPQSHRSPSRHRSSPISSPRPVGDHPLGGDRRRDHGDAA